ncbi:MAG: reverse transcriptase family protein, partial [Cyanobacteria bacterium J06553_1]
MDEQLFTSLGGVKRQDMGAAESVDGRPLRVVGGGVIKVIIFETSMDLEVRLLSQLPSGIILGRKFMAQQEIAVSWDRGRPCVTVGSRILTDAIARRAVNRESREALREVEEAIEVKKQIEDMAFPALSGDQKAEGELRNVLLRHVRVFVGLGCIKNTFHKIKLNPDTVPLAEPLRRRSPAQLEAEKEIVGKLLKAGVLEPSDSPWATYPVLTRKKTGAWRMTSDFRRLNAVTIPDAYEMEELSTVIQWLAGRRIFSSVDLRDGFFQIPLDPEVRHLTATRTALGLVQYCRMPQGLRNSPATLQRVLNGILGKERGISTIAYMD